VLLVDSGEKSLKGVIDGNLPRLIVFGFRKVDKPVPDLGPLEAEYFAFSHPGIKGAYHNGFNTKLRSKQ
jgi:hypothetical protein